jgi:N-acetylglucosaminyldiphosphoundecaprenol N-acetyl-beta-D-mannosaminyltransferase
MATKPYPEVIIGGLRTACLSRAGMIAQMLDDCFTARETRAHPRLIFTSNGHSISLAASNAEFRRLLNAADMIHADGQPVVMASKLTRAPIPERTATTDFIHDAAAAARVHGLRFYLLGATEEINARAAEILARTYPGLVVAGRRNGYFHRAEEPAICDAINAAHADVIWVALGVPFEQAFAVRNKRRLTGGWLVTAGGCFNFVAGDYKRAPEWMQRAGLEWLYRLLREPRRLFWRYAVTNPHAIWLMLTKSRQPKKLAGAAA